MSLPTLLQLPISVKSPARMTPSSGEPAFRAVVIYFTGFDVLEG
jgi:hypothetical protein